MGKKGYEWLGNHGNWDLNSNQHKIFDAFREPSIQLICYCGGNQSGKTWGGLLLAQSIMIGRYPWEPESMTGWIWENRGFPTSGIQILYCVQSWDQANDPLLSTFHSLWPKSRTLITKTNTQSIQHILKDKRTGNYIRILSCQQAEQNFEGIVAQALFIDEPILSSEQHSSLKRGLVNSKLSLTYFGMSFLQRHGSHLWNVANWRDPKTGHRDKRTVIIKTSMYSNAGYGLDRESIDAYALTLTDEEREIRVDGKLGFVSNLVFSGFEEELGSVVDGFPLDPSQFQVRCVVDIHASRPHFLLFLALSVDGRVYVVEESLISGDGKDIAAEILRVKSRIGCRMINPIGDTYGKFGQNESSSLWEQANDVLLSYGLQFTESKKLNKKDTVVMINSKFKNKEGDRQLRVFKTCVMSIHQFANWVWDYATGLPKKSKSQDVIKDDACDSLTYFYADGFSLVFEDDPGNEYQDDDYADVAKRDPITGY